MKFFSQPLEFNYKCGHCRAAFLTRVGLREHEKTHGIAPQPIVVAQAAIAEMAGPSERKPRQRASRRGVKQ